MEQVWPSATSPSTSEGLTEWWHQILGQVRLRNWIDTRLLPSLQEAHGSDGFDVCTFSRSVFYIVLSCFIISVFYIILEYSCTFFLSCCLIPVLQAVREDSVATLCESRQSSRSETPKAAWGSALLGTVCSGWFRILWCTYDFAFAFGDRLSPCLCTFVSSSSCCSACTVWQIAMANLILCGRKTLIWGWYAFVAPEAAAEQSGGQCGCFLGAICSLNLYRLEAVREGSVTVVSNADSRTDTPPVQTSTLFFCRTPKCLFPFTSSSGLGANLWWCVDEAKIDTWLKEQLDLLGSSLDQVLSTDDGSHFLEHSQRHTITEWQVMLNCASPQVSWGRDLPNGFSNSWCIEMVRLPTRRAWQLWALLGLGPIHPTYWP